MYNVFSVVSTQDSTTITALKSHERSIIWDVTLTFNEPGGAYDYTVFGEAPDAHDGPPADPYDVVKPPAPMPPFLRAWFDDNLPLPYNNLWKDYRHYPDTDKIWNLSVQWVPTDYATPTTVTITWNPTIVDNSEYTSVNLCTNTGTPLKNMLVDSTYTFSCPAMTPQYFKIICIVNNPPVFGTPSPTNGSTGNPLSFTWSIPINDPEGNTFSWTIQCNNGQTNSGSGAVNGTKALALSGLAYSTTYKVWVNATDPNPPGSGLWTKRWYTFTTMAQPWVNRPPTFSNPSPVNGSTGVRRYHATNVTVSDLDGNSTTVCFWYSLSSNPYSWVKAQQNNSVPANTTVRDLNSSYASGWNTQYWWRVTAYDGHANSSVIYTFTTMQSNSPPVFGTPLPANGSTGNPLSFTWSIPINDPEGNQFSWTIQCSNGQVASGTGAANGTKTLALTGLAYSTTYKVWVNATDPTGSGLYTRKWYTFTTKANQPPYVPSDPSPPNGATNVSIPLELFWTGGDPDPGDTVTYDVYFGTISPPVIMVHNQSATSHNPGTLLYQKTYYWRIVAWDSHNASTAGPIWNFTTEPDTAPPQVEIAIPQKGYLYINLADFIIMKIPFITTLIIGKLTVTANATDNQSGINRVEFYRDNELQATDTTAPYEWTWTERGHFFPYVLKAIAYDNAGHYSNSAEVKVWKIF